MYREKRRRLGLGSLHIYVVRHVGGGISPHSRRSTCWRWDLSTFSFDRACLPLSPWVSLCRCCAVPGRCCCPPRPGLSYTGMVLPSSSWAPLLHPGCCLRRHDPSHAGMVLSSSTWAVLCRRWLSLVVVGYPKPVLSPVLSSPRCRRLAGSGMDPPLLWLDRLAVGLIRWSWA
jgi:hypothetical protein